MAAVRSGLKSAVVLASNDCTWTLDCGYAIDVAKVSLTFIIHLFMGNISGIPTGRRSGATSFRANP